MTEEIDRLSFMPRGDEFVTKMKCANEPSPPLVIARIVLSDRTQPDSLEYPDGFNASLLQGIAYSVELVDVEVPISYGTGLALRGLGRQILCLNDEEKINPPLDKYETQAIQRLISVVSTTEVVIANRS